MRFPKIIHMNVRNEDDLSTKVIEHVKRNKRAYLSLTALLASQFVDVTPAFAAGGDIDSKGKEAFYKIAKVIKWAIIVRGTIKTGQDVIADDLTSAKSHFLGHLMTYALVLALPWGMDQIDWLFGTSAEASAK